MLELGCFPKILSIIFPTVTLILYISYTILITYDFIFVTLIFFFTFLLYSLNLSFYFFSNSDPNTLYIIYYTNTWRYCVNYNWLVVRAFAWGGRNWALQHAACRYSIRRRRRVSGSDCGTVRCLNSTAVTPGIDLIRSLCLTRRLTNVR